MSNSLKRATSSSKNTPSFDEQKWVINIRQTLVEEELQNNNEDEAPVSIFTVPKTLLLSHPDSYTPQEISIGPYHYWRPELYHMERYKLAAARRIGQKLLQNNVKFQTLVDDELLTIMPRIRSCYHRFLSYSNDTLAWMMAIDSCFLLEFVLSYAVKEDVELKRVSPVCMSKLIDYAGSTKAAHNALLRDIVMLENQIPLFVVSKVMHFQLLCLDSSDQMLMLMLIGLCNELSPFKYMEKENFPKMQISDIHHLLDYLYRILVPRLKKSPSMDQIEEIDDDGEEEEEEGNDKLEDSSYMQRFLSAVRNIFSKANLKKLIPLINKFFLSNFKLLFKLPWAVISRLPIFSLVKAPIESLFFSEKGEEKEEKETLYVNRPPLVEELAIPSVTELIKTGVKFSATTGNISTISFDDKSLTFYLPSLSIDVNTEVILRNLVAYETSCGSGPLVLTRYTELMNGIMDTEEDVQLLRKKGIILNHLKSDKEVVDMFDVMNNGIKMTKVPFLDKTIEDVNKFYDGRWRVKIERCAKRYIYSSWQILIVLACIMLLLLMTLQSFCSVYRCSRFFRFPQDSDAPYN
ncbi:hypothetical protein ACFE04_032000 [Oxalis oulophora]